MQYKGKSERSEAREVLDVSLLALQMGRKAWEGMLEATRSKDESLLESQPGNRDFSSATKELNLANNLNEFRSGYVPRSSSEKHSPANPLS